MNHQYRQLIQTIKIQHAKINFLESEISDHKIKVVNINSDNQILISKVKELEEINCTLKNEAEFQKQINEVVAIKMNDVSAELAAKSAELDCANAKMNDVCEELAAKSAELECANTKINDMTADLDKRNDTLYQIDKIILRNNDYFDEVKKELNDKIACGKEMAELYQNATNELLRVRNEMDLLCKELDATKTELQLYKNDFILKSATF
jgi:chromosome segregation ATPase